MLSFVLIVVASACGQGIEVICGTGLAKRLSVALVASKPGRYAVQYCQPAPHPAVQPPPAFWQWDLALKVVDQPRENCSYTRLGEKAPGKLHSQSFLNFTLEENCTYVCVSQNVDLLFRGCYSLQSKWAAATGHTSEPYNTFRYIDNDLTPEHFLNFTHLFKFYDYKNWASIVWYIELPVTDYEVYLCNDTQPDECSFVTRNCSLDGANQLWCSPLHVPRGCYILRLRHRAPWAAGSVFGALAFVHGEFCHWGEEAAEPAGSARDVPWAWALVALAGAAAGAVLLRRKQLNAALKKHVLEAWTARGASRPVCAPVVPPLEAVLLLHARDCPAVERFARALADLLRAQLDVTVWDIYSPRVVSLSGAAPAEWLRAKLAAPGVRTVLLQTPALRLLAPAHEPAQPLEAPLISRRVVHRSPHCADALLPMAVRALTSAPSPAAAYRAYYLATVSSLEVETLREVVPFRRYVLPGAAAALLRDLAPPAAPPSAPGAAPPPDERLRALHAAHDALLQYVRDNPNYLAQELMYL